MILMKADLEIPFHLYRDYDAECSKALLNSGYWYWYSDFLPIEETMYYEVPPLFFILQYCDKYLEI